VDEPPPPPSEEKPNTMTTKAKGKANTVDLARMLIAGTNKHLASATQVVLAGGTFTPAQITAKLQSLVTLRDEVNTAKASTEAKLTAERVETPSLFAFMDALMTYVKATFGNAPDVLADFGLHPKTRTPLSVEAKAAAVAKRKATRAARHTMGTQQKKGVKGAVTGIVVTPITAAPPAATAPTGSSASGASTTVAPTPGGSTPRTT
jgi:hypothetical protein